MWRNERRLFVTLCVVETDGMAAASARATTSFIILDVLPGRETVRSGRRANFTRSEPPLRDNRARMASASRPRPVRPARQVRRFKGPARRRPPPDRREFSLARRAPSAAVRRVRAGWSGGPAVPQGLLIAFCKRRQSQLCELLVHHS